jgi:hypothetical protein
VHVTEEHGGVGRVCDEASELEVHGGKEARNEKERPLNHCSD